MHLTNSGKPHATAQRNVATTPHSSHVQDPDGLTLAGDLRAREWHRLQAAPAYTVTSQDMVVGGASRTRSLGDVVDDEAAELGAGDWDRVVWQGGRVLAVVRVDADGRKSVTRFDRPNE